MIGFTELAKMKVQNDDAMLKRLNHVMDSGLQAKKLVKHLVTFSRNADVQRNDLLIVPLVKECIKLIRSSLPSSIEIHSDLSQAELTIHADPVQIHQMLMNFLDNSIQSMGDKGGILKITISSCEITDENLLKIMHLVKGRYVQLTLSDTGCGIPKKHVGKIFEPFFSTRARGESTGMGLSVAYGIIKEMKGHISVESTVGIGSTFTLFLPEQVAQNEDHLHASLSLQKGEGAIFVIDDDTSILEWTSQLLEGLGYEVTICEKSTQALEQFKNNPYRYDLVLTDIAMPKMTGLTLAHQIKIMRPDIPIILSTGFSEGVSPDTLKDHGIAEIIMKPMIAGRLSQVINNALQQKRDQK